MTKESTDHNASKSDKSSNTELEADRVNWFEKFISGGVVTGGLVITILLIAILYIQLTDTNNEFTSTATDCFSFTGQANSELGGDDFENLSKREACLVALEAEAQVLRTDRAQAIVAARLFIQSISILAGISLMTMGSSFIFARIKGPNSSIESTLPLGNNGDWSLIFNSYFPGVILTVLGTVIVVSTVYISTYQKSQTTDRPVFLDWPDGSYVALPPLARPEPLTAEEEKLKASGLEALIRDGLLDESDLESD